MDNGRPELENDLASARLSKGVALSALGQAAAAIAEYDAAIAIIAPLVDHGRPELRPDLARALANRAIAFLKIGQSEKAALDRTSAQELLAAANRDGMQGLEPLASWIASIGAGEPRIRPRFWRWIAALSLRLLNR